MKELLIRILKEVGQIQRESFRKSHAVEQKESISSVVTEVDLCCDKFISEEIRREFSTHNILTEESGMTYNGSKYTWVIDPLDGTSNFASGISWFGILIALFEDTTPVLAGAYLPIDDLLYFAEAGKGAYLNEKRLKIEHILLKDSLIGFAVDYSDDKDFLDYGMNLYQILIKNSRNIRCTNSLVDLMMVADGRMGGTMNLFTKIWDIAAPWLIIKEAGGIMKDIYNKEIEFDLHKNSIINKNFPIMAGSGSIIREILAAQKNQYPS